WPLTVATGLSSWQSAMSPAILHHRQSPPTMRPWPAPASRRAPPSGRGGQVERTRTSRSRSGRWASRVSLMVAQQFLCSVSFYSAWLLCGANWLLRQRREPADHDWGDVRTLSLGWYLAGDATDATSTRIPCRRSLM